MAPWTASVGSNRAAVEGAARAYHDAGISVGAYSVAGMWNRLTGSWRNGMPVWDTVAGAGQRAATGRCSTPSFTGGTRLLTQWWTPHQDFDVTCPGVTGHTASPSPLAAYRGTTLRVGSRGSSVAAVQRRVGTPADGAFGPQTAASGSAAFQRSHHLRPTGVVAAAEWRALGAWSTVPAASTGRMRQPLRAVLTVTGRLTPGGAPGRGVSRRRRRRAGPGSWRCGCPGARAAPRPCRRP